MGTGEELFKFLASLMLRKFHGTVTIRFESGKVTHVQTESKQMWQYKGLPSTAVLAFVLLSALAVWAQDDRASLLVRQLDAPEFRARQQATKALIEMGKQALPLLETAPKDLGREACGRVEFVRMTVSPPALSPEKARRIEKLVDIIVTSRGIGVGAPSNQAMHELTAIGHEALPALLRAVADPADQGAAGFARPVYVIRRMGDRSAVVPLMYLLAAGPTSRRAEIAETLGELGDPLAVPALLEAARDKQWYARTCIARALGKLKDRRGVPALMDYLQTDPHHSVRAGALEAVCKFGERATIEGLRVALADKNEGIMIRAVDLAGKYGDTSLVEALKKIAHNERFDVKIRRDAISALPQCGDEQVVPFLISLLDHEELTVRVSAVTALSITHLRPKPNAVRAGTTPEQWAECKAAWEKWWEENKESFVYGGRYSKAWIDERKWGEAESGCRMCIELENQEVRIGEPIRVDIALQIMPGRPPHRVLDLDLSRPGGNFPFAPVLESPDGRVLRPVRTEPEKYPPPPAAVRCCFFNDDPPVLRRVTFRQTESGLLKAYDAETLQFVFFDVSTPGTYRMQIRYFSHENRGQPSWPRELLSNPVELKISLKD